MLSLIVQNFSRVLLQTYPNAQSMRGISRQNGLVVDLKSAVELASAESSEQKHCVTASETLCGQ